MRKILEGFLLWSLLAICGFVHAGTVTYVYTDPQGTPLAEADAKGNITATFEYTPYGTYAPQGTSTPGPNPNGPAYTGHVNDPETNLVYMQARYYDPATGHFLSVDPAAPSAYGLFNFNRYDYADNNPIVHMDPDGRQTLPLYVYQTDWTDRNNRVAAGEIFKSFLPFYGVYNCASSGCGKVGWSFAAISAVGGAVGGFAKIATISKLSTVASDANQMTRVGRWMSAKEFKLMQSTGKVQESYSLTTHVASPGEITIFMSKAKTGSIYAEFDVATSSVKATSEGGVAKIIGPNSLEGRLAAQKGLLPPEMPEAKNIEHVATKIQ